MAHAGVNRLPSGCASAPGSSAASPASVAAVKTGSEREGRVNLLKRTHQLRVENAYAMHFNLSHVHEGTLDAAQWAIDYLCVTALVDCLTLTKQELCDSIESIIIVLSYDKIETNSRIGFQITHKMIRMIRL